MQNPKTYSTLLNEKSQPKPKVAMVFVYFVFGLVLCIFATSVWFSSYAKKVYLRHRPSFEREAGKIQYEIRKLELEENTLTDIERVRSLIKELGLVEPTRKSIDIQDK